MKQCPLWHGQLAHASGSNNERASDNEPQWRRAAGRWLFVGATLAITLCQLNCTTSHHPQAGLKATQADPDTAQPAYWLSQEPTAVVVHDEFIELWRAARRAAEGASFTIDRVDFRSGVITTFPLISKQAFEFWRNDVATLPALAESTLATVRRTLRWEIEQREDGTYQAVPIVLVERYAVEERRITWAMQYREIFSLERAEGSRRRDRGEFIPEEYWYTIGRDRPLEHRLAQSVRGMLK